MSDKDKRATIRHNYYVRHKEEEYAYCRRWALAHPDEKNDIQRNYYAENRDKIILRTAKRRELKRRHALYLLDHPEMAITAGDKEILAWARRGQTLHNYRNSTMTPKIVIAERCGVSGRTVYDWEHLYRPMSPEMLKKALA